EHERREKMGETPRNAGYPQYQVEPEGVWAFGKARGLDGYSIASVAEHFGWRAIGSWGCDGWDLGSWPLIVVFHREKNSHFDLALYVEGDVTTYSFPAQELLVRATEDIAFFHG